MSKKYIPIQSQLVVNIMRPKHKINLKNYFLEKSSNMNIKHDARHIYDFQREMLHIQLGIN